MRRELRSALWNRKLPLRAPEALIFRRIASPAITPVIPSGVEGFRGAILKVTHRDPSTVAQDDPRRVLSEAIIKASKQMRDGFLGFIAHVGETKGLAFDFAVTAVDDEMMFFA